MSRRKLSPAAQELMEACERNAFETALATTNGNIAAAARRCNMPVSTFHGWMQRLVIKAQRRVSNGA